MAVELVEKSIVDSFVEWYPANHLAGNLAVAVLLFLALVGLLTILDDLKENKGFLKKYTLKAMMGETEKSGGK